MRRVNGKPMELIFDTRRAAVGSEWMEGSEIKRAKSPGFGEMGGMNEKRELGE